MKFKARGYYNLAKIVVENLGKTGRKISYDVNACIDIIVVWTENRVKYGKDLYE